MPSVLGHATHEASVPAEHGTSSDPGAHVTLEQGEQVDALFRRKNPSAHTKSHPSIHAKAPPVTLPHFSQYVSRVEAHDTRYVPGEQAGDVHGLHPACVLKKPALHLNSHPSPHTTLSAFSAGGAQSAH
jgi:hypothetical protein